MNREWSTATKKTDLTVNEAVIEEGRGKVPQKQLRRSSLGQQ